MARSRNNLTAKAVDALKVPGRYSDGGGLYLAVDGEGASQRRRWLYLFNWNGKRREMGLGGFPAVSLKEARDVRDKAEADLRAGNSPIEARDARKASLSAGPKRTPTFGEMADSLIASKETEWRNDKHRTQWVMTLQKYCAPIRKLPVDKIGVEDVLTVLKPLWLRAPETASRLRGRIENVLDAAKVKGHRAGENPAMWRGNLEHLLPKRKKASKGHHAALPYSDVASLVSKLRERASISALALEFTILTAARSGETRGATWGEFDLNNKLWTVPASRMKAGVQHRVPLPARAIEIITNLKNASVSEYVFPNTSGGMLSDMTLAMALRRIQSGFTVHGMRSSFRDWAGNETPFPREVAEAALAHVVGDVEAAYRRSDALEKRRALMDLWAQYCEPKEGGNVVAFKKSGGGTA
jgi:integrase